MEDEEVGKLDEGFTLITLDSLSVDSLQEYLTTLQHEVNRVHREIEKKKLLRIKANSFFKDSKSE